MLGDIARFLRSDIGIAQRIQQGSFSVVHMSHHGDHGGPGDEAGFVVFQAFEADFHVGFADPFDVVAEFAYHQFRRVGVENLVDGGHDIHFHQCLDNVGAAFRHAVGEFLHGEGFGDNHVANDRLAFLNLE